MCSVRLEDETAIANTTVSHDHFEQIRFTITSEPFLLITGTAQTRPLYRPPPDP